MKKAKKIFALLLAAALILPAVPVAKIQAAGETGGTTYLTDLEVDSLCGTYSKASNYSRVSVHDPSIVIGYYDGNSYTAETKVYGEQNEGKTRKKIYFIFGTHRSFAYSEDLKNWKSFSNNINNGTEVNKLFADGKSWSQRGDSAYSLVSNWGSNLWAPDVIWNPDYKNKDGSKGAWMMYMSVNGRSWNSTIALLTSDTLNGDWTYQGTVIYSGFDNGTTYDYTKTDYKEVTGDSTLPARYLGGAWQWGDDPKCVASKWNTDYGAHAIDPCILFEGGELWMSYGSWSGGIYMIEIDKETGLRDKTHTYELKPNVSDPYMGLKIAGGSFASGEASYIQKIDNRFYLFITNGGLNADGGYNMRVFSSKNLTGPYKDLSGDDARYAKSNVASTYQNGTYTTIVNNEDNINGTVGNRLMSYYKWNFMTDGNTAQGHNSAMVDDDGKKFLIYHTRFVQDFFYQDRVHQLFVAKNGGLVTAPFEYCGETLASAAYEKEKVAGEYQILTMGDTNYKAKECVTEKSVTLNEDGTVSGEYTGTWTQGADGPYVTLEAAMNGGKKATYQGVFVEQKQEGSNWPVMCLTVVGNNDISIWGYRISDDKAAVAKNAGNFQTGLAEDTYGDVDLTAVLTDGVKVSWESSDPAVISNKGKVTLPKKDTEVTMTATLSRGNVAYKKEYQTTVRAAGLDAIDTEAGLEASYSFDNSSLKNEKNTAEIADLLTKGSASKPVLRDDLNRGSGVLHLYKGGTSGNAGVTKSSYARIKNPLKGKKVTGATVSLWVNCDDTDVWGEIWSFYDDNKTRLFLTQNAFFGFNNDSVYFDCNNGATPTNAIGRGRWKYVTVTVDKDSFGIYIDGVLAYTKNKYAAFAGSNYDTSMGEKVMGLINSSNYFYLGYGGFWGSGALSADNLKIYSKALGTAEAAKLYQTEKTKMDAESAAAKKAAEEKAAAEKAAAEKAAAEKAAAEKAAAEKAAAEKAAAEKAAAEEEVGEEAAVEEGEIYKAGKFKYKVTAVDDGKNKVTLTGVKSKSLTSATVGATVKIKGQTFKVTQIGASAFAGCKKLKKVTVGANVQKIGKKAFANCGRLKKITVKSKKLTSVGANALKGINKKAKIKVPSKKLKKYKKLFKKKGQKGSVKITK